MDVSTDTCMTAVEYMWEAVCKTKQRGEGQNTKWKIILRRICEKIIKDDIGIAKN